MIFSNLKLHLDRFFDDQFDFHTLTNTDNCPFVTIFHIQTKGRFSVQSYGFYVTERGKPAIHATRTLVNLSLTQIMASNYLLQDPKKVLPVEDANGFCNGFATSDNEIILCSVSAFPEDAQWVCKTTLLQLQIFIENS